MNRRQKVKAEAAKVEAVKKEALEKGVPLPLGSFEVRPFTGLDAAFGADIRDYPPMASIPVEFQRHSGKYQDVVSALFFRGGSLADHGLKLKDSIDKRSAMAAIRAYMCSFAPQHEHKTATVAWALSEWTEPTP